MAQKKTKKSVLLSTVILWTGLFFSVLLGLFLVLSFEKVSVDLHGPDVEIHILPGDDLSEKENNELNEVITDNGDEIIIDTLPPVTVLPPSVIVPPSLPPPKKIAFDCASFLESSSFFRDPKSQAARELDRLKQEGNDADAKLLERIACIPQGVWIIGDDLNFVSERAKTMVTQAADAKKIPILVLYNIPDHTTLTWWSGVGKTVKYSDWIQRISEGIGDNSVWIVLEPDAIGLFPNLSSEDQAVRASELKSAVEYIKDHNKNARVYLDGGHGNWRSPAIMASALKRSGIDRADGFFTNVANYQQLNDEISYGQTVSGLLGGKHFIIDTSRNGRAIEDTEWCNTPGVAIGALPTRETGAVGIDAFLWIKPPGESDGTCGGGPQAGKFWVERALTMIRESLF
ncbi:MAG: glycoside hydrolase family 6 protein [bacterium]|nr:glycoside hydrolase family 6 protein [bacterium]